jgi:hypothetical protein
MAKYLIVILAVLPLTVIAAMRPACAQVAADLSAPAGGGDFTATGLSASLSASNASGALGTSATGGGSRAHESNVSSGRSSLLTSRASHLAKYDEMMQATTTSGQERPKWVLQGLSGVHPSISPPRPLGPSYSGQLTAPAAVSSGRSSSSLRTPLYSFLMSNEKGASHPGRSEPGLSGKTNHMRNSNGSLIRSLTGLGSSRGLDR